MRKIKNADLSRAGWYTWGGVRNTLVQDAGWEQSKKCRIWAVRQSRLPGLIIFLLGDSINFAQSRIFLCLLSWALTGALDERLMGSTNTSSQHVSTASKSTRAPDDTIYLAYGIRDPKDTSMVFQLDLEIREMKPSCGLQSGLPTRELQDAIHKVLLRSTPRAFVPSTTRFVSTLLYGCLITIGRRLCFKSVMPHRVHICLPGHA
jgi:hypothetical protein